jgi:hypothetical protein
MPVSLERPSMSDGARNERRDGRWGAPLVIGVVGSLLASLVFALLVQPTFPSDLRARWTQSDDIEHVAEGYYRDLAAGRTDEALNRLDAKALRGLGGRERLRESILGNPIDFADVEVTPSHVTAKTATASLDGGLTIRRAGSGCRTYLGDLRLRHTGDEWKITRLPDSADSGSSCTADTSALTTSWSRAPLNAPGVPESKLMSGQTGSYALMTSTDSGLQIVSRTTVDPRHPLAHWARGYTQRIDPVRVRATSSREGGGKAGWASANTIDQDDDQHGSKWTSWISANGASSPSITYTFPIAVRLAYVRFKNGLGTDRDASAKPIRTATLTTDTASYAMQFPPFRTLYTYICDMGPTRHLKLTVNTVYNAAPSAALSQVEFWGRAAAAADGAAAPSLATLPLVQRLGSIPAEAQYVETCQATYG